MEKLIDIEKIKPMDFPSTEMDGLDVVRYLNTLPTVDAVEVVRCRDCKHYEQIPNIGVPVCTEFLGLTIQDADDFCSYGERKDGDGNG